MTEGKRSQLLSPAKRQRTVELFYPSHDLAQTSLPNTPSLELASHEAPLGPVSQDPLTHRQINAPEI